MSNTYHCTDTKMMNSYYNPLNLDIQQFCKHKTYLRQNMSYQNETKRALSLIFYNTLVSYTLYIPTSVSTLQMGLKLRTSLPTNILSYTSATEIPALY